MKLMSLEIKNLVLGYEDKIIVNNIDLSIPKGEITMLIGANGCGKSTLLSGMSRLLIPKEGDVLLEGVSIHDYKAKDLAKKLSILPQGPIAPEGITVKELCYFGRNPYKNLFGSRTKEDDDMVQWAIEATGLKEFANRQLDSLSGGQRQRISIARALIRNPKVIVLDEATSALDSISEKLIQEALNNLTKDRTTFIVAHRLSTIKDADKIAVIADGHCVEYGTYDELMELKGEFYQMKKIQS